MLLVLHYNQIYCIGRGVKLLSYEYRKGRNGAWTSSKPKSNGIDLVKYVINKEGGHIYSFPLIAKCCQFCQLELIAPSNKFSGYCLSRHVEELTLYRAWIDFEYELEHQLKKRNLFCRSILGSSFGILYTFLQETTSK